MPEKKIKIAVLGTRGFPNVQGGVEVHCEKLYPRLAEKGCEVVVFGRAPYLAGQTLFFKGVKIVPLDCPKNKFLEAFVHTFIGVFAAKKINPDIVHIHAVGPSIMVPLARLLGMKVVMTHHGPDYERKKWGRLAKIVLRMAEALGVGCANAVICVAQYIADAVKKKYGRDAVVIPNGVVIPEILTSEETLKRYGLEKGRYILTVGRFVPEKGFHDLIQAFTGGKARLVIVGKADHEDEYSRSLKEKAAKDPDIILTGFLSGKPLAELYSHAGLFVLPSYYEGLPIVLLEAMSYGLSCIASDIPANGEVGLAENRYFKAGDIEGLRKKIEEFVESGPLGGQEKTDQIKRIAGKYDWDAIACRTLEVYERVKRLI